MTTINDKGFSLIELLIAISVVALTLVSISSGVSFAVKNSRFSQEKSVSVRYAQESLEWFRSNRDRLGWNAFYSILEDDSPGSFSYCLDSIPGDLQGFQDLQVYVAPANCQIQTTMYTRLLEINLTDPSTVEVTSRVTWQDNSQTNETVLTTTLKQW